MKISFVVPVYNIQDYIEDCLNSLYNLDVEKEIIIINDESPDDSDLIIKKFIEQYPSESIYIKQLNKKLAESRNVGFRAASGDYIAFIDGDDYVDSKKYVKFINDVARDDLDVGIGNGYYLYESGEKKEFPRDSRIFDRQYSGLDFYQKSNELNSYRVEVWCYIYKRTFLLENNINFEKGMLYEDILYTYQVLRCAKKVKIFDNSFYYYRQRDGSIMKSFNKKSIDDLCSIASKLISYAITDNNKTLLTYVINQQWKLYINSKYINKDVIRELKNVNFNYHLKTKIKMYLLFVLSLIK